MRIDLMGTPLDAMSQRDLIGRVMESLAAGRGGWVITANLDLLRQGASSAELAALFHQADLVVADGMPLLWAGRLAGTPLPERVAGSDLIWSLTRDAAAHGRSVFLLGGPPGAAHRAAEVLRGQHLALRVAGTHTPPFGFEHDPRQLDLIRAGLRAARPDIVYVGLGFPKQERVIRELRGEFPGTWFLGVGASISFVAGVVPRAPRWLQRTGLEWLHRLALEPRRLGPRYLLHDLPFAVRLLAHSAASRARNRLGPPSAH